MAHGNLSDYSLPKLYLGSDEIRVGGHRTAQAPATVVKQAKGHR